MPFLYQGPVCKRCTEKRRVLSSSRCFAVTSSPLFRVCSFTTLTFYRMGRLSAFFSLLFFFFFALASNSSVAVFSGLRFLIFLVHGAFFPLFTEVSGVVFLSCALLPIIPVGRQVIGSGRRGRASPKQTIPTCVSVHERPPASVCGGTLGCSHTALLLGSCTILFLRSAVGFARLLWKGFTCPRKLVRACFGSRVRTRAKCSQRPCFAERLRVARLSTAVVIDRGTSGSPAMCLLMLPRTLRARATP